MADGLFDTFLASRSTPSGSEGSYYTPEQLARKNAPFVKRGPLKYTTDLSKQEEQEFRTWVAKNRIPFDPNESRPDYDMRGFFKALKSGDPRAATAVDPNDNRIHFPDYWKTPYDLTFSRESKFANSKAPTWNDKDQLVTPSGDVVFDDRNREPFLGRPAPRGLYGRFLERALQR